MSSPIAISPVSAAALIPAEHQLLPAQEQEGHERREGQLLTVQCRLSVGAPDDPLEEEADNMADKVMRMPEPAFVQRKCAHCEEEEKVQRRPLASFIQKKGDDGGTTTSEAVSQQISASRGNGSTLDAGTKSFMESRFDADFSGVTIHTGSTAVQMSRELNAQAFTVGNDIYFNEGRYNPQSESGKHLLAHELTHIVQQGGSPVAVQRRRVPAAADLSAALPTTSSITRPQAEIGMARVLSRAWAGLTTAQQTAVQTATAGLGLLPWTDEESLRRALIPVNRTTLISFAQDIRTVAPAAILGDPLLIDSGPRPATADAANIATLVTNATTIFTTLAGSTRNADIGQVFGVRNIAAAKAKYNNARIRMNLLHTTNKIVTDRSGYNAEVSLGGLTNSGQISVSPETIDNPNDNESVIVFIHECMHAGNATVEDFGYIHQASFTALAESVKLNNAAHFEVVPRRILGAAFDFAGRTFIPAGTTVGGTTAPALTPREQAVRQASERFRQAWTIGLNLHSLFVGLFRTPTEWSTLDLSTRFGGVAAGTHFSDTLPFWSNVESLTMHMRLTEINPSGTAAFMPVSIIDIALSEGLVRRLAQGMDAVPLTDIDALLMETTHATVAERTAAAASVAAERDLLVRLVIRTRLGHITGDVSRDESMVAKMGTTSNTWADILAARSPGLFP